MENTLITVIVPAYNHEKYIKDCLKSINNQSYRKFQWIIVDDGSTDETPNILIEYKEKMGYELIIQKNKGLSATLTDVIKNHAKGKYIACCASDDFWDSKKIEIQLDFMEHNLEYAMCYSNTHYIDKNSNIINRLKNDINYCSGYVFHEILCQKFHPPVNYMIRKDVLEEIGFYPSGIIAEDFYMNCMISYKYPIGYIPEKLSYYRVEELSKKRDPWALYSSHWDTIQLFKGTESYKEAVRCFNFRTFQQLSVYKKYKILAIRYMCKLSPKNIFTVTFLKGFAKLFIKWN